MARSFTCYDREGGQSAAQTITAENAEDAATLYVGDGADWEMSHSSTFWVAVTVEAPALPTDPDQRADTWEFKVPVHPREPALIGDEQGVGVHTWQEVPGSTRSSGGGIKWRERCTGCREERTHDTWGQDSTDGEQGLLAITYDRD